MDVIPSERRASGGVRAALVGWGIAVLLVVGVTIAASVAPGDVPGRHPGLWGFAVGIVAVSVQAAAQIGLRRSPRAALLLVCAVVPVAAGAGLGAATGAASVAVLIASFTVASELPWARAWGALAGAMATVALGELVRAARDEGWTVGSFGTAVLQGAATVGIGAAVGAVVAVRRETMQARVGQDRALAGEQVALTQAAVARERMAMARELHDIAAHHLSGIAVMTAALDRQIDTDPAGAKVAVREVRQQSTAMLRDLRSLVTLLREDDNGGAGLEVAPETVSGIRALVEGARRAGRDVELTVDGATGSEVPDLRVGPLAQLSAYRTVQESLSNAARHAPGARCDVVIDLRDPSQLVITVHNDPPPDPPPSPTRGSGFGIIGMQERAELTEARLSVGPTPAGGWLVRLAMPTPQDPQ